MHALIRKLLPYLCVLIITDAPACQTELAVMLEECQMMAPEKLLADEQIGSGERSLSAWRFGLHNDLREQKFAHDSHEYIVQQFYRGNHLLVVQLVEAVAENSSSDEVSASRLVMLSLYKLESLLMLGDIGKAESLLLTVLSDPPEYLRGRVLVAKARLAYQKGKNSEADTYLHKLAALGTAGVETELSQLQGESLRLVMGDSTVNPKDWDTLLQKVSLIASNTGRDYLRIRLDFVLALHRDGKYQVSVDALKSTLKTIKTSYGVEHPLMLEGITLLGEAYLKLDAASKGNKQRRRDRLTLPYSVRAAMLFGNTLKVLKARIGESHPKTLAMHVLTVKSILRVPHNYSMKKTLNQQASFFMQQWRIDSRKFLENALWLSDDETRKVYRDQMSDGRRLYFITQLQYGPESESLLGHELLQYSLDQKGILFDIAGSISRMMHNSAAQADSSVIKEFSELRREFAFESLYNPQKIDLSLKKRISELQREIAEQSLEKASNVGYEATKLFEKIRPDEVVVDFHVYRDGEKLKMVAVLAGNESVASPGEPYPAHVIEYDDYEKIDRAVLRLRSVMKAGMDYREASGIVRELLIAPIKEKFPAGVTTMLISPDGTLHLLPFVLVADDDVKVKMVSSLRSLLRNRPLVSAGKKIVIAGPEYNSKYPVSSGISYEDEKPVSQFSSIYFTELPGAVTEGKAVTQILGGRTELYTREEASEIRVKSVRSPELLHIATHGFYLENRNGGFDGTRGFHVLKSESTAEKVKTKSNLDPLTQTGLAFANANERHTSQNGEDGILTAYEALGLNLLGTKLVVLSACDTGVGSIDVGEGVNGLNLAFIEAGSQSVIYSLWPIDDRATQHFMKKLYENLNLYGSASRALRETQSYFKQHSEWSHPYYWAAFSIQKSSFDREEINDKTVH